jgi:hypothetical protein
MDSLKRPGRYGEENNLLPLLRIEPRFLSRRVVASSLHRLRDWDRSTVITIDLADVNHDDSSYSGSCLVAGFGINDVVLWALLSETSLTQSHYLYCTEQLHSYVFTSSIRTPGTL